MFCFDKPQHQKYHTTASIPDALPDFLDLNRASELPTTLVGRFEPGRLERLGGIARLDGYASVLLKVIEEPGGGRRIVNGRVQVDLSLTCQRCPGPLDLFRSGRFQTEIGACGGGH